MISYSFHPEAEAEFAEAALFYESRVIGLGRSFADAVQRTILRICQYPDAGASISMDRRRLLVHGFPYSVVYRQGRESVLILAVAHQSRRPAYWRRRQ